MVDGERKVGGILWITTVDSCASKCYLSPTEFLGLTALDGDHHDNSHHDSSYHGNNCHDNEAEGHVSVVAQVRQFYQDVRHRQKALLDVKADELPLPPSVIPGLLSRLRGYQTQALTWMLHREGMARSGVGGAEALGHPQLHPLWRRLQCGAGSQQLYFNPYSSK